MGKRTARDARAIDADMRRAIRESSGSAKVVAARYGVDRKTVLRWRNRSTVEDRPRGHWQAQVSTVLTAEEEAIAVAFRRSTLLPLDDCLYALQPRLPSLTRSNLYRCFKRHGVGKLDDSVASVRTSNSAELGTWVIEVRKQATSTGNRVAIVAIAAVSRLVHGEIYDLDYDSALEIFFKQLVMLVPYRIDHVVIHSPRQLKNAEELRDRIAAASPYSEFSQTKLDTIEMAWPLLEADGQITNELISEEAHRSHIKNFSIRYNYLRKLKMIGGRTPSSFVLDAWHDEPAAFWRAPVQRDPQFLKRIETTGHFDFDERF